jgi:hypothetical protein
LRNRELIVCLRHLYSPVEFVCGEFNVLSAIGVGVREENVVDVDEEMRGVGGGGIGEAFVGVAIVMG